jgi:hypothetical protein
MWTSPKIHTAGLEGSPQLIRLKLDLAINTSTGTMYSLYFDVPVGRRDELSGRYRLWSNPDNRG